MRNLVFGFLMMFALAVRNSDSLGKIPWSDHRFALMVLSTAEIGVDVAKVQIANSLFRPLRSNLYFDGRDIATVLYMGFVGSVLRSNGVFISIIMVLGSLVYVSVTSRRIFCTHQGSRCTARILDGTYFRNSMVEDFLKRMSRPVVFWSIFLF
jgi:hypothetical protein